MSWVFFLISPFENNFHALEPASTVFCGEISLNIPCTDPEVNGFDWVLGGLVSAREHLLVLLFPLVFSKSLSTSQGLLTHLARR